jgi:hypothetical protein
VSSQVVTSDSGQDSEKRTIYTPGENWFWYVLFFTGSAAAAWITRSTNGGGPNNGMMLYAALSIVFGLGAGIALKSRWVTGGRWQYSFVLGVIAIQFIGLIYNPFNYLPTAQEIHSNERVINKIRSSEKPIFIPYRSHLNGIYGDAPQIHIVNLFELTGYFMGNVKEEGYKLVDEIRSNICRQEYSLIILDQPVPWFDSQLEQAYYLDLDTKNLDQGQSQLLGWQLGFQRTYIPRHAYNRESCLASISMGQ